ncbi:shikimate kinase [Pullulanibacillus pueri]|uniref:Shikimate kinase n=1 Tax=Pullulanibacillus pueri TaxID=1437324 RepID=A0A8J2ZUK4_9BACL|nr:shikimate kinase [Pullulanibacillus pueri]MBM7681557.1 shikimate kinase [Pullulanibacillus pueri]GGH79682.1 shikimate kinase [Pullulanibacillus pueri]
METLFIIGFMGAGKTTVGRELGQRLSMNVVDTDEMIEKACKKSISSIFKEEGEAAFRQYEQRVLQTLAWPSTIVTTGGGIIITEANRKFMKNNGIVIFLHSDPQVVLERTAEDTTRPLLNEDRERQVTLLLNQRLPLYLEADYTVNTSFKSVDTIVDEITGFLTRDSRFWVK